MIYFPTLDLGYIQNLVSLFLFVLCFIGAFFISSFFIRKKVNKYKYSYIVMLAFILSIPGCVILDITVGNIAFSKIHVLTNKHMPTSATCIEYNPAFSYLKAKYKISPVALKEWTEKYKLQEDPQYTFKSKMAPNGQGIVAIYDPKQQILIIRYNAF